MVLIVEIFVIYWYYIYVRQRNWY